MKFPQFDFLFLKRAFSDGDQPSSSRIVSAVCALACIVWGTHVVFHNHVFPGAMDMAGVTAFSTSHYVACKVTAIFDKK